LRRGFERFVLLTAIAPCGLEVAELAHGGLPGAFCIQPVGHQFGDAHVDVETQFLVHVGRDGAAAQEPERASRGHGQAPSRTASMART
jgi:hypothetical protein